MKAMYIDAPGQVSIKDESLTSTRRLLKLTKLLKL